MYRVVQRKLLVIFRLGYKIIGLFWLVGKQSQLGLGGAHKMFVTRISKGQKMLP